jgi:hypothetical protein
LRLGETAVRCDAAAVDKAGEASLTMEVPPLSPDSGEREMQLAKLFLAVRKRHELLTGEIRP